MIETFQDCDLRIVWDTGRETLLIRRGNENCEVVIDFMEFEPLAFKAMARLFERVAEYLDDYTDMHQWEEDDEEEGV